VKDEVTFLKNRGGCFLRLKKLVKGEEGQSLVLVTIALAVLMGFTGLVIDGGRLYIAKAELQKAVDAGALAGASVMSEGLESNTGYNHTEAELEAESVTVLNYSGSDITFDATFPEENTIQVTGQENVPLFLMPIIGVDRNTTVSAIAKAKVGNVSTVDGGYIIPIGVQLNQTLAYGEIWDITSSPGDGAKGNFGLLDFSSFDSAPPNSGANAVGHYIENGSPAPIAIGQPIPTQTGVPINSDPIKSAITDKIGKLVYVPIISEFGSGSSTVTVLGFAAFELVGIDWNGGPDSSKTVKAKFLETFLPGEIGSVTTNYGTYSTQLVL
jgi:hypothetical protein